MTTVSKLAVAPVKGMALVARTAIVLEADGVAENRAFFLVTDEGRHLSGLGHGPLVRIVPTWDLAAGRLELRFPDAGCIEDAVVLGEAVAIPFQGRELRGRVVEGPFSAAISAYAGRNLRLVRSDRTAAANEAPVSILSEASVAALERAADHPGPIDDRRFRMLVTIRGGAAHEEEGWIGRDVRLGPEAVVRVTVATPRCATTTRDPSTGLRDFDALEAILAYRGLSPTRTIDFGVYGTVVRPGRVAIDDEVQLA